LRARILGRYNLSVALGIAVLALFSIVMLTWNIASRDAVRGAEDRVEHWRKLATLQTREIEELRKRAHALELHLQLKERKKKAPAPDPAVLKRRVMDAASRAFDEAMRG
jgi:hypothetical protein